MFGGQDNTAISKLALKTAEINNSSQFTSPKNAPTAKILGVTGKILATFLINFDHKNVHIFHHIITNRLTRLKHCDVWTDRSH
jgi:hypothetical protein